MKIIDVKTYVLRCEVEEPFTSARGWWYTTKNAMLVKVVTDAGIEGWGEAYGPPRVSQAVVDSLLRDQVVGHDPFHAEVLWEKMYSRIKDYGPRGMAIAAISAIDIALWDIMGKAVGRPVHDLLGGSYRMQVEAYATGFYYKNVDDQIRAAVEEAKRLEDLGFRAFKLKIGVGIEDDVRRIAAVREVLGEGARIMVDANHAYNVKNALRLGRHLEQMGVEWFEEPIDPNDLDGYARLSQTLDIPIAGAENAFTRFHFKEIIARRAMDIIQPDVCCAGGLTEGKRIAVLAETWNVPMVPHVWGSAVGMAAAVHLLAATPDFPHTWKPIPPLLEYEQTYSPFREDLAVNPIRQRDGWVRVPDRPGLGIEIAPAVLEKYGVR
jgi:D-galactarolactone cycloisomerase